MNQNQYFKVIATKEELKLLGIDYPITGKKVKGLKQYPSGFIQISVRINKFNYKFDIPSGLLVKL